jgi:hypothetical protein
LAPFDHKLLLPDPLHWLPANNAAGSSTRLAAKDLLIARAAESPPENLGWIGLV